MKSFIIKSIPWVFSLTIIFTSCTEPYDIDLSNRAPVFVVDGVITDQPGPHVVRLTTSADYFSNKKVPAVSNATVTINDGFSTINLVEAIDSAGYYLTPNDYVGVAGRTYHLVINNVDVNRDSIMETYEASSVLNSCLPVDSVTMSYSEEQGGKYWKVRLHAQDDGSRLDNYAFKVYKNDTLISNQYSKMMVVNDDFFNGNYASVDVFWLEEVDEDGKRPFEAPNLNDVYTMEANGITRLFYDYVVAVQIEMGPKIPIFSGPSANVPTNISNGGFGWFTAHSVTQNSMVVTQKTLGQMK